jgi:hypothetical protein
VGEGGVGDGGVGEGEGVGDGGVGDGGVGEGEGGGGGGAGGSFVQSVRLEQPTLPLAEKTTWSPLAEQLAARL